MKLLGRRTRLVYSRQPPLSDWSARAIRTIVGIDAGTESLKVAVADCGVRVRGRAR
jgi:hypothetical protein